MVDPGFRCADVLSFSHPHTYTHQRAREIEVIKVWENKRNTVTMVGSEILYMISSMRRILISSRS